MDGLSSQMSQKTESIDSVEKPAEATAEPEAEPAYPSLDPPVVEPPPPAPESTPAAEAAPTTEKDDDSDTHSSATVATVEIKVRV